MRYYELTNTPRPTKPEEQTCTVRLIVSRPQLHQLQTVLDRHDGTEFIGSTHIGMGISAAEVLCCDASTADRLSEAWLTHIQVSPIRPCFQKNL
jgi:hypothetical protein